MSHSISIYASPPMPVLDHSHLKPGSKASLLSHAKTLELYRANAKKSSDPEVSFEFAVFMMDVARELGNADTEKPPEPGTGDQRNSRFVFARALSRYMSPSDARASLLGAAKSFWQKRLPF
jgi:hypothetical protein